MKTLALSSSLRFALALGLLAPTTFVACSSDLASEVDVLENENEIYESSIDSAPEFDAEDSLRRPTIEGSLQHQTGLVGSFSRTKKFLGYTALAQPGESLHFELSPPITTLEVHEGLPVPQTGYRLALYRQGANGLPRGRALAVGTSPDGGRVVQLDFESESSEALIIVAYRLRDGSSRGVFQISLTVESEPSGACYFGEPSGCGEDEYCKIPDGMCLLPTFAPIEGQCTAKPDAWIEIYAPVCGCDGNTYGNEGEAAGQGINIAHVGECPGQPQGQACGGIAGLVCGEDEFCDYEADALCGAADDLGTCKPKPEVCTFHIEPVCGCDGQTYSNECFANAAGVSAVPGACVHNQE